MIDVDARQRARAIAQRRGLGQFANDTKWDEFFSKILAPTASLEIKLIDGDQVFMCSPAFAPVKGYVEGGEMGPVQYVLVEWIRSRIVEPVRAEAISVGLEFEVRDGAVTVFGYR